jgi:hypothetical protein
MYITMKSNTMCRNSSHTGTIPQQNGVHPVTDATGLAVSSSTSPTSQVATGSALASEEVSRGSEAAAGSSVDRRVEQPIEPTFHR